MGKHSLGIDALVGWVDYIASDAGTVAFDDYDVSGSGAYAALAPELLAHSATVPMAGRRALRESIVLPQSAD